LTGAPSNITGIAATIEVGGGGGSHGGGYGGGGGTGGGGGSEGDEKKRASSCLVKVVLQWSPGKKEKYNLMIGNVLTLEAPLKSTVSKAFFLGLRTQHMHAA
jgi:hypothetical protein